MMAGGVSTEIASGPLGKYLAEHSDISRQLFSQSGIAGFSCGQHGMSSGIAVSDDVVTVPAAMTPAQAGAAAGAVTMPTIARIGKSWRSQNRIIMPDKLHYCALQRNRALRHRELRSRSCQELERDHCGSSPSPSLVRVARKSLVSTVSGKVGRMQRPQIGCALHLLQWRKCRRAFREKLFRITDNSIHQVDARHRITEKWVTFSDTSCR